MKSTVKVVFNSYLPCAQKNLAMVCHFFLLYIKTCIQNLAYLKKKNLRM